MFQPPTMPFTLAKEAEPTLPGPKALMRLNVAPALRVRVPRVTFPPVPALVTNSELAPELKTVLPGPLAEGDVRHHLLVSTCRLDDALPQHGGIGGRFRSRSR